MWRYLEGVKQPPGPGSKKRNAVYDREYEKTKRQRTFRTEWASSGRTWLVNTDEAGMYCLACKSHPTASAIDNNKKGNMVSGTKSYKLDTIVKHERSKQHIAALDIWNRKPKEESDAGKIIMNLNKDIYQKLVRMFRNCHALISNCRPLSDFVWLCQLDAMKGLQMGETYRNVMSAKNFVTAIAHVEFRNIAKIVDEAKFLCVIGEGSTDTSIREQEMWFVRLCIKGDIKVYFIGVESAERADAEHIVSGLKNIILENLMMDSAEFIRKLVSLGCDGASVMVGCKAGVSALLKQEQPCVVTVHCMAHRLELCLKDAAKKVSVYDKIINTLLMGIYYFYYNSTLNRSMLLRTFNAIKTGDDKLLIPVKSGGTRWIGHQLRAITAVVTSYKFIVAHLEQTGTACCVGSMKKSLQQKKSFCSTRTDFGDEDLHQLMDHFRPVLKEAGVDLEEAELEWSFLKMQVSNKRRQSPKDFVPDWKVINQEYSDRFKNILPVMDLLLTLSLSSAEAERGFSQLKLIKTKLRTNLSDTSLNEQLAIKLLSPSMENFDPDDAIQYWNTSVLRSRRPNFMKDRVQQRKKDKENEDVQEIHEHDSMEAEFEGQGVESEETERDNDSVEVESEGQAVESEETERDNDSVKLSLKGRQWKARRQREIMTVWKLSLKGRQWKARRQREKMTVWKMSSKHRRLKVGK
ncbi:hypothetical protein FSP39_017756 [Pinctada imbricata]|uniref:Zinc finger protein 862 n=1 Tax=Pinctada imbricata TaxID=66713 RepID=A0AA88YLC3_PINIB|nr:hypothetical protein FSP39_017756 [Pinctada imbricata]